MKEQELQRRFTNKENQSVMNLLIEKIVCLLGTQGVEESLAMASLAEGLEAGLCQLHLTKKFVELGKGEFCRKK
jgi:hypothetical protein